MERPKSPENQRAEPPPIDSDLVYGPLTPPEPYDALERLLEALEWKWEVWKNDH